MFFARPISWIDGLEDPDAREAVMELVLKSPERYEEYVETRVERQDGTDPKSLSIALDMDYSNARMGNCTFKRWPEAG